MATTDPPQFLPKQRCRGSSILRRGYDVVGPTIDQEAIVYGNCFPSISFPGLTDEQAPGSTGRRVAR
jgi:hypothetical protein